MKRFILYVLTNLAVLGRSAKEAALPGGDGCIRLSGRFETRVRRLFMSHPSITERIEALRSACFA